MFRINLNEKIMIPIQLIDVDERNEELFGKVNPKSLGSEMEREGFNGAIEAWRKPDGRYLISSGHTRYLAAVQKGAKEIPCLVEDMPADNSKRISKLIMSNVYQKNISPMAFARCLKTYDEEVLKKEPKQWEGDRLSELARRFQMTRSSAHRYMSLLKLIPQYSSLLEQTGSPYTAFVPLTSLDSSAQEAVYPELLRISGGDLISLTTKSVETVIHNLKEPNIPAAIVNPVSTDIPDSPAVARTFGFPSSGSGLVNRNVLQDYNHLSIDDGITYSECGEIDDNLAAVVRMLDQYTNSDFKVRNKDKCMYNIKMAELLIEKLKRKI